MKNATDLDQSRVLKKILLPESADVCWTNHLFNNILSSWRIESTPPTEYKNLLDYYYVQGYLIEPAWSLDALFGVLPTTIGNFFEKNALRLRMDKGENDFNIWYENFDYGDVAEGLDVIKDNPVDACYEMIIKLHELKLI